MILRRLLQGLLLLSALSLLCFLLFQAVPGDAVSDLRLDPGVSRETMENLRRQRGLDQPLPVRYWSWLTSLLHGDWGRSYAYQRPVAELLFPRAVQTLLLNLSALLLAWALALPLAYRRARETESPIARAASGAASVLVCVPDLLLALSALWLAFHTGWFRTAGSAPLCASCVALLLFPAVFRHAGAAFREALRMPHVLAALGAGMDGWRLALWWVLPPAAAPLLALLGLQISASLSASLIVEVVLGWPGLGTLLLDAVLGRDLPVLMGSILLSGSLLITGNLLADLLQIALDPRARRRS
jgi:peptide/nickel transport system permease protein